MIPYDPATETVRQRPEGDIHYTYDGWEIQERSIGTCPQHGEYPKVRISHGWRGGCLGCLEERQQRERIEMERQRREQRIERLLESACLPPRFARKDFDNFNPGTQAQRAALAVCRGYVGSLRENVANGSCLVLIGPPGVGKTHLLAATARAAVYAECYARYTTMLQFLAAIKGCWAWHGDELGRDFLAPAVLALDEIWKPQSDRDRESMLALLDARYLQQKPTLIGSNLSWPDMKNDFGARFCDRLIEGGKVVPMDGESHRVPA